MVGRLVQQQQIHRFADQPRQFDTAPLSVRQLTDAQSERVRAEQAERQQLVGVRVPVTGAAVGERPQYGQRRGERGLLLP